MSQNEINGKVQEFKSLVTLRNEIDEQLKSLEADIKGYMAAAGAEEMQAGLFKVKWKNVTSGRFDARRFKADFPDVYLEYVTMSTVRRFTVA